VFNTVADVEEKVFGLR